MVIFNSYVKLPEGIYISHSIHIAFPLYIYIFLLYPYSSSLNRYIHYISKWIGTSHKFNWLDNYSMYMIIVTYVYHRTYIKNVWNHQPDIYISLYCPTIFTSHIISARYSHTWPASNFLNPLAWAFDQNWFWHKKGRRTGVRIMVWSGYISCFYGKHLHQWRYCMGIYEAITEVESWWFWLGSDPTSWDINYITPIINVTYIYIST